MTSGVTGSSRPNPVKRPTRSGRCTCLSSSGMPTALRVATTTPRVVPAGTTGSWSPGALNNRARAPSAFMSSRSGALTSSNFSNSSASSPLSLSGRGRAPRDGHVAARFQFRGNKRRPVRRFGGHVEPARLLRRRRMQVRGGRRDDGRNPRSTASPASRYISVALPPLPTMATVSPRRIPSVSRKGVSAAGPLTNRLPDGYESIGAAAAGSAARGPCPRGIPRYGRTRPRRRCRCPGSAAGTRSRVR